MLFDVSFVFARGNRNQASDVYLHSSISFSSPCTPENTRDVRVTREISPGNSIELFSERNSEENQLVKLLSVLIQSEEEEEEKINDNLHGDY